MPRICIKSIKENNWSYYDNVLNYVAKKDKCAEPMIGACNVYMPINRKEIVPVIRMQFNEVKHFYEQENHRLGIHFEINFSPEELRYLDRKKILEIGYWISETQFKNHMTYFAVHDHSECLHLDMLINTVNILTGNMYGCGNAGWNAVANEIHEHLKLYVPDETIISRQITFPK